MGQNDPCVFLSFITFFNLKIEDRLALNVAVAFPSLSDVRAVGSVP